MTTRYIQNGDYQLNAVTLYTNTEATVELDLMQAMYDMTLYESIYTPIMSGNITIIESTNEVREYGIGNGELIKISYNTAGVETPTYYFGIVYKISTPNRITDHSNGYTLHFMSPEAFESIRHKVFNGYTEEISSIVSKLYEQMRSPGDSKNVEITPTMNIENYVFTGDSVLDAIDIVTKDAVSAASESGFLFFEDSEKFNFVPLEKLYLQEPVVEYFYKNSGMFDDIDQRLAESFNAYQDFEVVTPNNYLQKTLDGEYGSLWGIFSTYTKSLSIYEYGNSFQYDRAKSLGIGPQLLKLNNQHYELNKLSVEYSNENETKFQARINNRMTKLRSSTIMFSIGVFGDSTLRVGQTCKAHIPNWSSNSTTVSDGDRNVIGEKFLIAEIKHQFTRNLYTQRIKIIKDAYEEQS